MHREWSPPDGYEAPIALLACYICGNRIDEEIALHRLFCGPRSNGRADAWKRIRQLVAKGRLYA